MKHHWLVAGVGCRRGCDATSLTALLDAALRAKGLPRAALCGLATLEAKADEPALLALASALGVPLVGYTVAQLAAYDDRLTQRSAIAWRTTGCHGIAESAALAHCEAIGQRPAVLYVPRRHNEQATLALAVSVA